MQTILVKCLEKIVFPLQLQIHKRCAAQLPKMLLRNLTGGGSTYPQLPTKQKNVVHCSDLYSHLIWSL